MIELPKDWQKLNEQCDPRTVIEQRLVWYFYRAREWCHRPLEPAFGPCTRATVRAADLRGVCLLYAQYPIPPYRVDFLLVQEGSAPLVVECDGYTFHEGASPAKQLYDQRRIEYLRAQGWNTVVLTGSTIMRGDGVGAVENALGPAAEREECRPAGLESYLPRHELQIVEVLAGRVVCETQCRSGVELLRVKRRYGGLLYPIFRKEWLLGGRERHLARELQLTEGLLHERDYEPPTIRPRVIPHGPPPVPLYQ